VPVYCYQCNKCGEKYEERHSMTFKVKSCRYCESEDIHKIPSDYSTTIKQQNSKAPTGSVVKKYIQDTKEDIKRQKQELKTEKI
tara:strand:+ start:279 stop:530 length:252 start_codon:yes stop_codon:yes gene_type:complete